jgi:polar amino acid transport system substrate-binding protein
MKVIFCIIALIFCVTKNTYSQDLHIGIEPFPPIITESGTGYAIDMFKAIEAISDLKFHFHVMNYARAKKELNNNSLDLIGLTPKGYETADFYQYAEDLEWSLPAKIDLFTLNKNYFNTLALPEQSIGTLRGNADFFSELLDIPRNKFIEVSSLAQLIQMLERKRLNVITFERAATMSTLEKFKVTDVYYKKVAEVPASFAVQNNESGKELKVKIDYYLNKIKSNHYFTAYFHYQNLEDTGKITQLDNN